MSNCSTFKILIDRFAGQRLSVTVDCSWARSGPQTSSPQARDNRRKFRAAPRKWHAKFLMPPEVSQMLGVRRTTLTLIAQDLQTAGLIRYRRGRIEIVDRNGLEDKACECYGGITRQSEPVVPQAPS